MTPTGTILFMLSSGQSTGDRHITAPSPAVCPNELRILKFFNAELPGSELFLISMGYILSLCVMMRSISQPLLSR